MYWEEKFSLITPLFIDDNIEWWKMNLWSFMWSSIQSKWNFIIIRRVERVYVMRFIAKKNSFTLPKQLNFPYDMHQSFLPTDVCLLFKPLELQFIWTDVTQTDRLIWVCNMKRQCIRMWHPFKRVFTVFFSLSRQDISMHTYTYICIAWLSTMLMTRRIFFSVSRDGWMIKLYACRYRRALTYFSVEQTIW